MKIRQKIAAGIVAAGMLGAGMVAVAPASQAGSDSMIRAHHGTGGLGGNVKIERRGGSQQLIAVGGTESGLSKDSSEPRYVFAGGGYCVWEELYINGSTKVGDFNHGKSAAANTKFFMEGAYRAAVRPANDTYWSTLRIYSC